MSTLDDIYRLVAEDRDDYALDLLYAHVDERCDAGDWMALDALLAHVNLERLGTDLMIGLLSITLSAADELPGRGAFVGRCRAWLTARDPGRADLLLRGLG